ncbi:uncharacterized protein LOC6566866 [Drosophila grimshawi]|uniref:GH13323 n=1 Tax=Drosophila grimshawi TaxID=7222 RepID=B4JPW5_DROGR|nr:uncharacterized protein LOC6566866 [Drosophila grimshawi]EDV98945.1 GH13323 [Drosophila grimshawi]
MEMLCVCIAALLQLKGYSIFIMQPEDACSPAPPLGSYFFLLATICFLWDLNIYPRRFEHMNKRWKLFVELVACIFLAEIATLIIWCGLERVVCFVTQKLIGYLSQGNCKEPLRYWLLGLATTSVGGSLFCFIMEATQQKFGSTWQQLWYMVSSLWRMNSCDRRRTLKACHMAMFPSRRNCENGEEEDEEEEEDDGDEEEGDSEGNQVSD